MTRLIRQHMTRGILCLGLVLTSAGAVSGLGAASFIWSRPHGDHLCVCQVRTVPGCMGGREFDDQVRAVEQAHPPRPS